MLERRIQTFYSMIVVVGTVRNGMMYVFSVCSVDIDLYRMKPTSDVTFMLVILFCIVLPLYNVYDLQAAFDYTNTY